jgi:hypothetical protein
METILFIQNILLIIFLPLTCNNRATHLSVEMLVFAQKKNDPWQSAAGGPPCLWAK